MTDNEIIKALNKCLYGYKSCDECPLCNDPCEIDHGGVPTFITDLINRQKAEIERFIKRIDGQKRALFEQQAYTAELQKELATAKAEAIKAFAERLKEKSFYLSFYPDWETWAIEERDIDNLVKEMVGD